MKSTLGAFRASTLMEVIVASILFLLVFLLSMELLVRIGFTQPEDQRLRTETDRQSCLQEFRNGNFPAGEYRRSYCWGEITVRIELYRNLQSVQQIEFVTRVEKENRKMYFRVLKTHAAYESAP
ncbi:MAG: hypothetical protein LUD68_00825 [Rikenellaceae bacterium]|nr:hypothetical protein [Rikenellaceae bacterium]